MANVKLNQRLREIPDVESIFIHPNMGDGGCGTGAALMEFEGEEALRRRLPNVFLGPCFGETAIVAALNRAQLPFEMYRPVESAELERQLASLRTRMTTAAGLWVAWPKKASGVVTDMTEDVVRAVALPTGLVDNKVCAIDEVWSGLRLVIRLENRDKSKRG